MKHIPEERLSTIGKLIGVIREEKRDKSQNKYTMKSFVDGICTVNTLKRIEAGEIARIEAVYVELLEKLNLKLGYFPAVDEAILELMNPLYEAIEYYRVEDISKYCDMSLRVLIKVKDYAYYSEIYDLFLATKEYFEETKIISLQKMERFRNEYMLFDEKYHSLFKIMVFFRGQIEAHNDPKLFENIIEELGFLETDNLTEATLSLNYYISFNKYVSLKEKAIELETRLIRKENYVRLLDVYNYVLFVLIRTEYRVGKTYLEKAEKIIQSNNIPTIKVLDYYSNIAAALHEEKIFDVALEYYEKMVNVADSSKLWIPSLICMAHCQRVIGKEVDIPILEDIVLKNSSELLQKAYRYFTMKEIKPFVKINYILKDLAPILVYDGIIEIFRDEMTLLVEETGSYKNLFIYNKIVKENLNDWDDDFIRKSE